MVVDQDKIPRFDKIKFLVFYQDTKETRSCHPWSGQRNIFRKRSWSCHLLSWSCLSTGGKSGPKWRSKQRTLLKKFRSTTTTYLLPQLSPRSPQYSLSDEVPFQSSEFQNNSTPLRSVCVKVGLSAGYSGAVTEKI